MSPHIVIDHIINFWTDKILQGSASIPKEKLKDVGMPEKILNNFIQRGEEVVIEKLNQICDSPFLDSSVRAGEEGGLVDRMAELLWERLIFPANIVKDIVSVTYTNMFNEWRDNPISFAEVIENPEETADTIFNRAKDLSTISVEGDRFGAEMLLMISEASGIVFLADIIKIEKELGANKLDKNQFTVSIRRALMLKEYFESMKTETETEVEEEFFDEDENAYEDDPTEENCEEPVTETEEYSDIEVETVIVETPTEDTMAEEAVEAEDETESEEYPEEEEQTNIIIPETEYESSVRMSFETAEPEVEPAPAQEPEPAAPAVAEEEEPKEPGDILRSVLLDPENMEYFTKELFDNNEGAYRAMVERTCSQKKLKNVLAIANNELFLRDIPPSAFAASTLIKTIKTNFVE